MQHRNTVSPQGLIFFLVVSLVVLGLFVIPAIAQTQDPLVGETATLEDEDGDGEVDRILIPVGNCNVSENASVTVSDAGGQEAVLEGTQVRVIEKPNQLIIVPESGEAFPRNLEPGSGTVIRSTGVTCQDDTNGGDGGNGGRTNGTEPDDHQYNADGKEVTVIIDTIPDKKVLVDTGGPSFATVGALLLGFGLVGFGILVLRRT